MGIFFFPGPVFPMAEIKCGPWTTERECKKGCGLVIRPCGWHFFHWEKWDKAPALDLLWEPFVSFGLKC